MTKAKGKRENGRPTSLNPETHHKIVMYIKAGGYIETAAVAAGVHKTTLYDWLKKATKEKEGPYRAFADDVDKALAESEMMDVGRISKAAQDGVWQAAAWRLERKHPERWGRREKIEHVGKDGGAISIDETHSLKAYSLLSTEQLENKIAELMSRLGDVAKPKET